MHDTVRPSRPLFERIKQPIATFAGHKLAGGGLLILATLVALVWANSPWGETYRALLHAKVTLGVEPMMLTKTLVHWVNDGLMGVFFFVVGLEIKREFLAGELSSPSQALLPIAAAVGGMVVPALVFLLFNFGQPTIDGWAIPMATDIAFVLGIMALLGDRVPASVKVFLTALAIVDDIGAIVVIAVFYTDSISLYALGVGALILVVSMAANRIGVRNPVFYFVLGTLTWLAFLESGVHATLAAVLMAFTIPARSRITPRLFVDRVEDLLGDFRATVDGHSGRMLSDEQQATLDDVVHQIHRVKAPAQHLEHAIMPVVTFVVLPVFALANAGVHLEASTVGALGQPLALGIMLGLFVGKQVGVLGASWLAVRTGLASLPEGVSYRHVYGAGILAGVGFTMSLFIGELAFSDMQVRSIAKMSTLLASLVAGVIGWALLRYWAGDGAPQG